MTEGNGERRYFADDLKEIKTLVKTLDAQLAGIIPRIDSLSALHKVNFEHLQTIIAHGDAENAQRYTYLQENLKESVNPRLKTLEDELDDLKGALSGLKEAQNVRWGRLLGFGLGLVVLSGGASVGLIKALGG